MSRTTQPEDLALRRRLKRQNVSRWPVRSQKDFRYRWQGPLVSLGLSA